jgi:hypothetical protein
MKGLEPSQINLLEPKVPAAVYRIPATSKLDGVSVIYLMRI